MGDLENTPDESTIVIPGEPEIVLPVEKDKKTLSLCLLEIGCKPDGKYRQLKHKREILLRHFMINQDQLFSVYRGSVFFNGECDRYFCKSYSVKHRLRPDFSVHYNQIPEDLLEMDDETLDTLVMAVRKPNKREDAEKALREKDIGFVAQVVCNPESNGYANFKGVLTEYLVLTDIERARKGIGISVFPNTQLDIGNKAHPEGAEVDAILSFYNDRFFRKLLGRLEHSPHLEVRYNNGGRHKIFSA